MINYQVIMSKGKKSPYDMFKNLKFADTAQDDDCQEIELILTHTLGKARMVLSAKWHPDLFDTDDKGYTYFNMDKYFAENGFKVYKQSYPGTNIFKAKKRDGSRFEVLVAEYE